PVPDRGSQPRLRTDRPGEGQPGDAADPARCIAYRERGHAGCGARPRRPHRARDRCRSVRNGERVPAGGRPTVGAARRAGRAGRRGRHHDHALCSQESAHHLFARAGVRRQAAHRRGDAPLRHVVRGSRAGQASGRPARVLRNRSAGAVQGSDGAAGQSPVAVFLRGQRIRQGRPGRAGRRLRVDRRRRRHGGRATRRAMRGGQSAGQHVVVAAPASADAGAGCARADDRSWAGLEEFRLMAKINLLPWRAERRERRKREFFTHLAVAFVAALVLVLLWGFWVSLRIGNQNDRNEYLKGQITQLDAKITEIQNLQKVKDHLLARKRIVEKLQSSRSQMVHLFDQIVQTIPAGARVTGLKQQGDKLTLDGVAQSNATVAEYMRNIEASPWMGPTTLVSTTNVHNTTNTPYEFELVVALTTLNSDDHGAPASGSSVAP